MRFRTTLAFLALTCVSPWAFADQQAQIDALLAMSPTDRRAALKAIPADERNGLWFAVKKAQFERKGHQFSGSKAGDKNEQPLKPTRPAGAKAPGTIQYDDGTVTTSFNISNAIIGNRFDTHATGNVMVSGTVDTVVAVVVQGSAFTTSSAGFVMLGPETVSGGAMALFSTFTAGDGGPTDTVTFTGLGASYTGSSYYVLFGAFNNSYVPAFGTGSTNGQGHHGVIGLTGGMGPNITTISDQTTLNALVRTTGNVLPVELMQFTVD